MLLQTDKPGNEYGRNRIHRAEENGHDYQHDDHQNGHIDGFLAGRPVYLTQFAGRFTVISLNGVRLFTRFFFYRLRFLLLKRGASFLLLSQFKILNFLYG
jgi:hypothetical protein